MPVLKTRGKEIKRSGGFALGIQETPDLFALLFSPAFGSAR
jgi:hypothetical protein